MLDYLSNESAPLLNVAKKEISNNFLKSKSRLDKKYHNFIDYVNTTTFMKNECIDKAFHLSDVLDRNFSIKFSYSGWYIFGQKEVLDALEGVIIKYYNRIYIRGILKSLYAFKTLYKNTIEKMYMPDSNYVKNVIQPHFYSLT
jgi:hypothetical protein